MDLLAADASPDRIRDEMARTITDLLEGQPGPSIKARLNRLAAAIGMRAGRLEDYRYREIARPTADEYLALAAYAARSSCNRARAAALRARIEETRHGRALETDRRTFVVGDGILGTDGQRVAAGAGGADRPAAELYRLAGRVIDCRRLPLAAATPAHRALAAMATATKGEFTDAVAAGMEAEGLAATSWLYRDVEDLPVLYVGRDLPALKGIDPARVLSRPVAEQPLPPAFLSLVLDHLRALLQPLAGPTLHRITVALGGEVHTYDRLGTRWKTSGLVGSSCVLA